MTKRTRKIVIGLCGAMLLLVLMTNRQTDTVPDLSGDEEPFCSMSLPPRSVVGVGYMDGGSVTVVITDHARRETKITFPIAHGKITNPYPSAYIGEFDSPTFVALKNPDRAREIAIILLEKYGEETVLPIVEEDLDQSKRVLQALKNPTGAKAMRLMRRVEDVLGINEP